MTPESAQLAEALVAAYRPHVHRRLDDRGAREVEGLAEALGEGERWLRAELERVLSRPYPDQPRGPLEVFQEAMRFPTDALDRAGVEPPERDPVAANALPGDRHDLAPASSAELGEEVWEVHLAWGAAKARAVAGIVAEEEDT